MSDRVYESAVLMNAALEDEQIKNIIEKIKETITGGNGEIIDFEDWGRKRLAYMIKKNKIGYYAIFRYKAPTEVLPKLEKLFKLDDNILRALTIKLSKAALEQIEKDKTREESSESDLNSEPELESSEDINNSEIEND